MPDQPALALLQGGVVDYKLALQKQHELHDKCTSGEAAGFLFICEHPPVLTLGRNRGSSSVLASREDLRQRGIKVVATERGGDVTAHMPGQLVAYPVISFRALSLTPKRYVHLLEEVVIAVLRTFGLHGQRDKDHPGVWIGDDKVCALGVRVQNRASMHGLALNVNANLDLFKLIVPCGISGRGVTSISSQILTNISVAEVIPVFLNHFAEIFAVRLLQGATEPRLAK